MFFKMKQAFVLLAASTFLSGNVGVSAIEDGRGKLSGIRDPMVTKLSSIRKLTYEKVEGEWTSSGCPSDATWGDECEIPAGFKYQECTFPGGKICICRFDQQLFMCLPPPPNIIRPVPAVPAQTDKPVAPPTSPPLPVADPTAAPILTGVPAPPTSSSPTDEAFDPIPAPISVPVPATPAPVVIEGTDGPTATYPPTEMGPTFSPTEMQPTFSPTETLPTYSPTATYPPSVSQRPTFSPTELGPTFNPTATYPPTELPGGGGSGGGDGLAPEFMGETTTQSNGQVCPVDPSEANGTNCCQFLPADPGVGVEATCIYTSGGSLTQCDCAGQLDDSGNSYCETIGWNCRTP